MKRPLACVGFLYLAAQMLAALLPPVAFLPLAAVFMAAGFPAVKYGGRFRAHLALLFLVPAAALLMRAAAFAVWIVPIRTRADAEARIHASVLETDTGFAEDTVRAVVLVDAVDGIAVRPFRVRFQALPETAPGECFSAKVRFSEIEENAYRFSNYADGIFLDGAYLSDYRSEGESPALWARACRRRAVLVSALKQTVARPYSGMAAAITVGDRSSLEDETEEVLRRAGLAHVIVVSGLHLSALSGLVYAALRRVAGYRAAAAGAMAAVLALIVLIGSTPSVVRAGVAMLLLYGGMLLSRRSDGLTSLGAAALLLCVQNPYAALDIGLLLSFSATLGVLWVVDVRRRWRAEHSQPEQGLARLGIGLVWAALIPVVTSVTTLPVLSVIGSGVSLLGPVSNLLVVPLLPAAVGFGLIAQIFALVPGFGFLARLAGLACSLILRWMLCVARWAASVPHTFVHVNGTFALCALVLFCGLVWAAWRLRVSFWRAAAFCLLFAAWCALSYAAADSGVVRILLAGNGANPAVVVLEGWKTAVLYRGPDSNLAAVQDVLERYNRTGVDFLVDLRTEPAPEELTKALAARETICVRDDLVNHAVYAPFYDVLLYVRRQAGGNLACIEVRGCRVGVASGGVDLSALPALNVYIAGTGRPAGLSCAELILPRAESCRWLEDTPVEARRWGRARITLRAGASLTIREE